MSWSGSPAPAGDFGDLRTVLRKSSLRNMDKAGHKTGSYQAKRIFQDYVLSEAAVILEVGLPLPLAEFLIWLSVDGVYWTHWSAVKPGAMIRSARGLCGSRPRRQFEPSARFPGHY